MPFLLPIWLSTHLKWSTQSSWQLFTVQIVLTVVAHPELRWDVCMKIFHDRETYLRWVLLLLHSLQLTLQLTFLTLWSLSNKISTFFCNIRKIARHNNQQNWMGLTFCQPWLGFVRLVTSAMEMWNIWGLVEFNFNSLFEITSLLIVVKTCNYLIMTRTEEIILFCICS